MVHKIYGMGLEENRKMIIKSEDIKSHFHFRVVSKEIDKTTPGWKVKSFGFSGEKSGKTIKDAFVFYSVKEECLVCGGEVDGQDEEYFSNVRPFIINTALNTIDLKE